MQLIDILKNHFPQWQPEINFVSPRAGDIQHSQADISKISSCLDFHPQWSAESAINFFIASSLNNNDNYSKPRLTLSAEDLENQNCIVNKKIIKYLNKNEAFI